MLMLAGLLLPVGGVKNFSSAGEASSSWPGAMVAACAGVSTAKAGGSGLASAMLEAVFRWVWRIVWSCSSYLLSGEKMCGTN